VNLEISSWTRRERLERIAAAERDRRAGRSALALASLGEAVEWPARIVLALVRLPQDEGEATRELLVSTLDEWAEQAGLASLDAAPATEEGSFATPIALDEIDRAFAEAEAQTDEMLDANSVAARVLMSEPVGLSELGDAASEVPRPGEPIETDAARVVSPLWSSPFDVEPEERTDLTGDGSAGRESEAGRAPTQRCVGRASREQQIATLERWLSNLEQRRMTQNVRGAR
jgi:hypothetical protein